MAADQYPHNKRVTIVVGAAYVIKTHWQDLVTWLQEAGWEVCIIAPYDEAMKTSFEAQQIRYLPIPLKRAGLNPFHELATIRAMAKACKASSSDIVQAISLKSVIYIGLLARLNFVKAPRIFLITGLGHLFNKPGIKGVLYRLLMKTALFIACRNSNQQVIFQNQTNYQQFIDQKLVHPTQAQVFACTGIDLEHYQPRLAQSNAPIRVIFVGRFVRDKGIYELVQAAEMIKASHADLNVAFHLIGHLDHESNNAISQSEIDQWLSQGSIDACYFSDDMPSMYQQADIMCLPSYHEGLPKTIQEAAATGLAIVASDIPGCRQAITHEVDGLLVPARDAIKLAEALLRVIEDKNLREMLGAQARKTAETAFNNQHIKQQWLDIFK